MKFLTTFFAGTAKTNGILHGVDQGVHLQDSEVNVLSDDDDDAVPSIPPPPSTLVGATSSQTRRTKATNQLGCEG